MRKNVFGRRFRRDANERKALFKGLMSSLILYERIKTTDEKAKAIKGKVEKLVTKVKKNGVGASHTLSMYLNKEASAKLIADIAPRFATRPGGYTRIIKMSERIDSAKMVVMEWVEGPVVKSIKGGDNKKETKKDSGEILDAEIVTVPAKKTKVKKIALKKTVKK